MEFPVHEYNGEEQKPGFFVSDDFKKYARVQDKKLFELAEQNPIAYWEREAQELVWFCGWHTPLEQELPHVRWFSGARTNITYNVLDRHLPEKKDTIAFYWQGEDAAQARTITYAELFEQVQRCANGLKSLGIKKGDRVAIYMPMILESIVAILACARIGAVHTVVFAGFSAQALADRIQDSGAVCVITADATYRKQKFYKLKERVDQAVDATKTVQTVIVVNHCGQSFHYYERDVMYHALLAEQDVFCSAESMDAEDPLFILYTSGTTGKPKGVVHTVGGYMVGAYSTTKYVFDVKPNDIFWCTADIGWITGHTYIVYGPLLNGMTQLIYEGALQYPHKGRTWELIQQYGVTILYTAPTAIRMFSSWSDDIPHAYDLSSLRLLGSVGEPLNPQAWMWYYKHIGNERCPIVDTWWQTETGSIMITGLPGVDQCKPGYAGKPLPAIDVKLLNRQGEATEKVGLLAVGRPWPSMMRTIWGDDARYRSYFSSTSDVLLYITGDAAMQDDEGNVMILGRVDDVINVSGHRIGSAELESSLVEHAAVAEAAVVPRAHAVTGQEIIAFVMLKHHDSYVNDQSIGSILQEHVAFTIGSFARPAYVVIVPDFPKTRSGKIMRRLLRELVEGRPLSDTTTLADPDIVEKIAELMKGSVT